MKKGLKIFLIIIFIILMAVLVLGLTLTRRSFRSATDSVNDIDSHVIHSRK